GQLLLDAARTAGVAVPEQVAVVGVDNDELICELCEPRLSSVVPNSLYGGYVAARLLDGMLKGKVSAGEGIDVDPDQVICRASSDIFSLDDALVVEALKTIREQCFERINVEQLAEGLSISRRTLDKRFVTALGRTPHEVISQLRISRVKGLLLASMAPLAEIADQTGFEHVEYLCAAFKRAVGTTPGEYRRSRGTGGRLRKKRPSAGTKPATSGR
ncbi:MAG TPA: helix-turn-helix domain-containing protein, partial [Caulifigura sp.]|nr:helix-turn-helix domain-containing protein [Caulifigura sp.]